MCNISRITTYLSLFSMLLVIVIGCSNSKHPVSPVIDTPDVIADSSNGNHQLVGIWTAEFDPQSNSVKITPDRDTSAHYNVVSMLPPPEIIFNSYDPFSNILSIDLMIENPYAISGYDVRLIVYTDAIGHLLLNADNWTNLFDIPGGEIINPFMAYAKPEPSRIFAGPTEHTENLQILIPGNNFFGLNFAIDVSYPGNCPEPYEIDNFIQAPLTRKTGSTGNISVDVLDWQSDVTEVYLYCPAVIGPSLLTLSQINTETWEAVLTNNTGASVGEYTGIFVAFSASSGALALYDKVTIVVNNLWVKTWGDTSHDVGYSVTTDTGGDVYVTGYFRDTVDFGDGNPITSNGNQDAYLLKLDTHGNFIWVKTWGGFSYDKGNSVTTDASGDVYIIGRFDETVDFGDGNPITSNGMVDAYLLKLYTNGNFGWIETWGGAGWDEGTSVTTDIGGDIYLTGQFGNTVDFGDGNPITSEGSYDAYLLKLNTNGNFIWVETWGGTTQDGGHSVATGRGDYVYVTGRFAEKVDFGNGNPITANGNYDAYLLKLDSTSHFVLVRTWGSAGVDIGNSVATDTDGDVYVTGHFAGTVDFGNGMPIASNGSFDAYLLKWYSNGNLDWVETWGDWDEDLGKSVTTDSNDDVYVTGSFFYTVDFGDGNPITSNGATDAYLLKLDSGGNFGWVETWGDWLSDSGESVTTDIGGDGYVTGYFRSTVDFGDGIPISSNGEEDAFVLMFAAH